MSADTLRFDYLIECSILMESYSRSLGEAAFRGNEQHAREYFKCLQRVGRDLDKTLKEIERGVSTGSRQTDGGKRDPAGRADAAAA